MKKNIAIGILIAVSLLFFTFSYVQKRETDEMTNLAQKYYEEANQQRYDCLTQERLAEQRLIVLQDSIKKLSKK